MTPPHLQQRHLWDLERQSRENEARNAKTPPCDFCGSVMEKRVNNNHITAWHCAACGKNVTINRVM